MAAPTAVWGIEIGQCALKAVKVRLVEEGKLELLAFDLIEHPKILSQPDAEPEPLIKAAIEKFASRNDVGHDPIVFGVPGQQTFARFCKLPPVDAKKIPDIVRFEASQQIPFDMDDVVWDYEVFSKPDSPETEVGIFAMRKDLVRKHIDLLASVGLTPTSIQTLPTALYNVGRFENPPADEHSATVLIDVGAQNTDLVVIETNGAWTRNIPLGGNSFTEALIKAFKLSFAKAESLKRTAATSKYARQIFQAMRPVFAELVAEIQRSLGFYGQTHRDVHLKQVVALGNAFRLPGLQKYLENNLSFDGGVLKPERFNALVPSATVNAPQFSENLLGFGAAYGLALHGLGLARIKANLLPAELARVAVWRKKTPYWIGTAACVALAAVSPWVRLKALDQPALDGGEETVKLAKNELATAQSRSSAFQAAKANETPALERIKKLTDQQSQARVLPMIYQFVFDALPAPDARLANVKSAADLKAVLANNKALVRNQRKQIYLESVSVTYAGNIDTFAGDASGGGGGDTGAFPGAGGFGTSGPPGMMGGFGSGPPGMMSGPHGFGFGGGGGEGGGGASVEGGLAEAAENPGFSVRIRGRLLYGENPADASKVIEEYCANLRRQGKDFHDFYVPADDPTKRNACFSKPTIKAYAPSSAALGGPMGAAAIDPRVLDPVTGESMASDWVFDFSFRIKLGELPKEPAAAAPTPAPGTPKPPRQR